MRRILSEFRLYICNHFISHIPSHTLRLWFYTSIMGFKLGKGSTIFMNCKFDCARGLTIGQNSIINANCRIDSRGSIEIGNNVSISEDVIILTADHDELFEISGRNKKVIIEDYVWIGTRATIMPGVTLGKGAVVATGAIVTKNVETLNVVAGIPARFIKTRPATFEYTAEYKRLFH
ncbi:MAG: acyltransferase [Paludibacter sp.]|nr:acyltransferase [Paludibacter sp.]